MSEDLKGFAEWLKANVTSLGHLAYLPGPDDGEKVPFYVAPKPGGGVTITSLKGTVDEYRKNPETIRGTAAMLDLCSLIDHVNRFRNVDSALFANNSRSAPSLTAVIDYHDRLNGAPQETLSPEPKPRYGRHRVHYAFPLSDEWKAWAEKNDAEMTQIGFAEFLEDRITDVSAAPDEFTGAVSPAIRDLSALLGGAFAGPSKLLELSRGMTVNVDARVKSAFNPGTGESSVVYETQNNDGFGAPLKVPNLFLIQIPVFVSGPLYRLAVRLRYRVVSNTLKWRFVLFRADKVFDDAFLEAVGTAKAGTNLPLVIGAPES